MESCSTTGRFESVPYLADRPGPERSAELLKRAPGRGARAEPPMFPPGQPRFCLNCSGIIAITAPARVSLVGASPRGARRWHARTREPIPI